MRRLIWPKAGLGALYLLFVSVHFAGGRLYAGDANPPRTMMKVVVEAVGPQIPEDSFGAKPKTFYMAGLQYGRLEEADDPTMKLHELIVISEPDTWMINLRDRTGKHLKDPGPTFEMHMPVFSVDGLPKLLYSFELGHEFEFFEKVSKKKKYEKTLGGKKYDSYAVGTGGYMVVVYTEPGVEAPLFAFLFKGDDPVLTIRYLDYEKLPFAASFFQVPSGMTLSEAQTGK